MPGTQGGGHHSKQREPPRPPVSPAQSQRGANRPTRSMYFPPVWISEPQGVAERVQGDERDRLWVWGSAVVGTGRRGF